MPAEHWAEVGPFVRAVATAVEHKTPYAAQRLLSILTTHAYWCWHVAGVPLETRYVFRYEVITQSTHSLVGVTKATRGTYRSKLLRVADALAAIEPGTGAQVTFRPPGLPGADPSAPYTPAQQFLLRGWAENQRTETLRVNARIMLACTLGAGLATAELLRLEIGHIEVDDDGVLLHLVGDRPRVVPVLAEWEADLIAIAAAALRTDIYAFTPRRTSLNPRALYNFIHRSGARPFDINVQRLRATWIVTHLTAGTPVQALLDAAGIETLKGVGRFLEFAPDIDPGHARKALVQRARAEGSSASWSDPVRDSERRRRASERIRGEQPDGKDPGRRGHYGHASRPEHPEHPQPGPTGAGS